MEEKIQAGPLQDALAHNRLLIRSEPGAGKTTFMKLLTWLFRSRQERPGRLKSDLCRIQNDLSIVDFKPQNPDYDKIIRRVQGIFEPDTFRQVPVQIRAQAANALAMAGDSRFDTIQWIEIPEGEFYMGAQKNDKNGHNYDPNAYIGERPVHKVKLSSYKISRFPVTVDMFKKFIDAGGYKDKEFWQAGGFAAYENPRDWDEQLQTPARPVVKICWYEAAAFARWCGGRLPTEAEWEYAARGKDSRIYPWGDNIPNRDSCNFSEAKLGGPSPVGIFPKNRSLFGVLDMAGNV